MKNLRKIRSLVMVGLCAIGFVCLSYRDGYSFAFNAKLPNNGSTIDNVVEVSPTLPAPYNKPSAAIAWVLQNTTPSILNMVIIKVHSGVYDDHFVIPQYVKIEGDGQDPALAYGVTKISSSTTLPVITMNSDTSINNLAVFWSTGNPQPTSTNYALVEVQHQGGITAEDIGNCSFLGGGLGGPTSLVGVHISQGATVDLLNSLMVSLGIAVRIDEGSLTMDRFILVDNQSIGIETACGSNGCGSATLTNGNISTPGSPAIQNDGGNISIGSVVSINSVINNSSGTISIANSDIQNLVNISTGSIKVDHSTISGSATNNGTGSMMFGVSKLASLPQNPGGGTVRTIGCYDNSYFPIP